MKRIVRDTLAKLPENRVGRIYKTTSLAGFKIDAFWELHLSKYFYNPERNFWIFSPSDFLFKSFNLLDVHSGHFELIFFSSAQRKNVEKTVASGRQKF